MEKFHKDKNKIKSLKVRKGIPLFINFCYNQGIRNKLNNSKLYIESGVLHYHLKFESGFVDNDNGGAIVKESVQYVVKNIIDYNITSDKIIINGEIEKTKDGNEKTKKIVNSISLFRIYQDETKLIEFLNEQKVGNTPVDK